MVALQGTRPATAPVDPARASTGRWDQPRGPSSRPVVLPQLWWAVAGARRRDGCAGSGGREAKPPERAPDQVRFAAPLIPAAARTPPTPPAPGSDTDPRSRPGSREPRRTPR